MLGVGGSEIIIIGLLFLLIFGPSKLPQMARDIGRFVGEARRSIDEFKDELTMEPDPDEKPARRRESRNGSKKSTASLKNKKDNEENSDDEEKETSEKETSEKETSEKETSEKETSQTASRTETEEKNDEEPELRDL